MENIYELSGLIQLYEATGDAGYEKRAMERIDGSMGAAGVLLTGEEAGAYLFAMRLAGNGERPEKGRRTEHSEEEYRNAAQTVFWRLENGGEEKTERSMPFYTAYDTAFHRKAHYGAVAELFGQKKAWTGSDLAALADTIGAMSMEIYEYYRALCDLFKKVVKSGSWLEDGDALAVYAVLRACNLGVLQSEKYKEAVMAALCRLKLDGCPADMVRAQKLIFEMRQDGLLRNW